MNLLRRWRRPRPEPQATQAPFELDWEVIPAERLASYGPSLLDDLLDGRRDGATITGIFSQDEIDTALHAFESVEQLDFIWGRMLGMAIGMLGPDPDRTPYLDSTESARRHYREAFGFDPQDRIAERLRPIAGSLDLVAPEEDGRSYNPGQMRWWVPGRGGLPAHVGNEFRRHLEDGAMKHLITVTDIANHLSYFVVLQRPQHGGELSVYDLVWEDNRGRDDWESQMPDDGWIESVRCVKIDPDPGDMVLFGGGWRWHRVDPPTGDVERITYGGFAARSIDGHQLHFWS